MKDPVVVTSQMSWLESQMGTPEKMHRSASVVDISSFLVNSPQRALADGESVWLYDSGTLMPGSGKWTKAVVVKAVSSSKVVVRLSKLEGDTWSPADGRDVEVDKRIIQASNHERQDDTEDVAELSHLNEPAMVEHIRKRYVTAKTKHGAGLVPTGIYTRAGAVVVAMNPFTPVESLYSDEQLTLYRRAADSGGDDQLPPHIFEVAARAFARVQKREAQSIVINGESGAGKTETTKRLLGYFARAAGGKGQGVYVSDALMRSNPALEAFGNAKTVRNDNSSRFGKFVTLHFRADDPSELAYGSVQQYLLEKTRVVQQSKGEQAYHAFYHLVLGAPDQMRSQMRLGDISKAIASFNYLHGPMDAKTGPGRGDATSAGNFFDQTHAALVSLAGGGSGGEATALRFWRTVAGVLHLGQLTFDDRSGEACLVESDRPSLTLAAQLLEMSDVATVEYALTNRTIGSSKTPRTGTEAAAARDALAKAFYEGLFDELIATVNKALKPAGSSSDVSNARIGLLDIFGSEVFDTNRFEQLLINYANDKLQNYFKQTTVGKVKELYEREEIGLSHLPSSEPPPSLSLLEGPPPSLTGREKVDRLRMHFHLSESYDEAAVVSMLESHLGIRSPDGRSREHRLEEVFKAVYRTSLLQLLVDRGNYTDKATERERRPSAASTRERSNSLVSAGGLGSADEKLGTSLASFCAKHPAYVTAGRFDNQPVGLSWRYALDTDHGGEWLKVGTFEKAKTAGAGFALRHFGSVVFYDIDAFTATNNDYVDADLAKLVTKHAATAGKHATSAGVERKTVAGKFKTEMRKLVDETLAPSAGHFIRCIKPNHEGVRFKLDDASSMSLTLTQLNTCGVLEAAQISAAGLPNRLDYFAVLNQFGFNTTKFRKHSRRRFTKAPTVAKDAATLARRQKNLLARFPHANAAEVAKLLETHRGHAGRASKQLAIAASRLDGSSRDRGSKVAKVKMMLTEVYGLQETTHFVCGKTLLFLRANVLNQMQKHQSRYEQCRERVGHQMGVHEVHYRIWWNILAEAQDKVKLAVTLANNAKEEAARRQALFEAENVRQKKMAEAVEEARAQGAQMMKDQLERAHTAERSAMEQEYQTKMHTLQTTLAHEASKRLQSELAKVMKDSEGRLVQMRNQLVHEFETTMAAERHAAMADKASAVQAIEMREEAALREMHALRTHEANEHAREVATLQEAVRAAAADRTLVLQAQAEARAALQQAEAQHQQEMADALYDADYNQRVMADQMERQAATELRQVRTQYENALRQAKREVVEALDELDRVRENTRQEFEHMMRDELRHARAEEKKRQEGSWAAHLTRALNERNGVAQPTGAPTEEEMSGEAPSAAEMRPRRMSKAQIKEAAELAEWEERANVAKKKEANDVADWIEAARVAKAKEAAELEEWRRRAQEAKMAQGLA